MVRLIENMIQNAHVIFSKSLIFFFALNPLAIKSDLCRFPLSLKLRFFFQVYHNIILYAAYGRF